MEVISDFSLQSAETTDSNSQSQLSGKDPAKFQAKEILESSIKHVSDER